MKLPDLIEASAIEKELEQKKFEDNKRFKETRRINRKT